MARKRIVICCDGTWNTRDRDRATNVSKLAQAVATECVDGTGQVVFYDQGVGTDPGFDRWLGGAFGVGLSRNVGDAYRFLVDNYNHGTSEADRDEIFVFGFSRGAFTARSMAGLIRKIGLLPKENAERFHEAYGLYRDDMALDAKEVLDFRAAAKCRDVVITVLGVWDTVGALGVPGHIGQYPPFSWLNRDFEFHDVKLSSVVVRHAYQALAIDEQRDAFEPAVWWRFRPRPELGEFPQTLEQCWFAGCHSDVGGGSTTVREAERRGALSDIALDWMVGKAKGHGLECSEEYLRTRLHPEPAAAIHDSRKGIEGKILRKLVRPIGQLPLDDPGLKQVLASRREKHHGLDDAALIALDPPIEAPQALHPSVCERRARVPGYAPENLTAYLAANPGQCE